MMASAEKAVVRLLKKRPFYGYLLAGLRKSASSSPNAVGITISAGIPILKINETILSSYPNSEQEALLEHCLLHLLHLHPLRRRERNRHDWDMAADLAINPLIVDMPVDAPFPANFHLPDGMAAEEYYRALVDPFDSGNLKGAGHGDGEIDDTGNKGGAGQSPLDDHSVWDEADSTPLPLAEEMVRSMVREAWQRSGGEVPGEVQSLVESMLAPGKIPWKMILRQFMATAGRFGKKSTWQRENRRFAHLTPGNRKRHRLNLLIGIDVSDSTDLVKLREEFAAELMSLSRGAESRITVLYSNSRIQRIETLRGAMVTTEVYHGGGFTDLRPVFEYAKGLQPPPVAIIYMTDGFGEAPLEMEFPTLWVLTEDGEKPVPWGVELRLGGC